MNIVTMAQIMPLTKVKGKLNIKRDFIILSDAGRIAIYALMIGSDETLNRTTA